MTTQQEQASMQDLTPVGLTEDKTKLLLVSDTGEEFTVAADARLRAALRGEPARSGQLETRMDSALRPRDIQARIRAGESPEAVADAAQTTVDRIMNYASPVLAERAHIAERAQRASIRRKAGEGPARILGDTVAEQLRGQNIDPASVSWDSWRREDGRWVVVADFAVAEQPRHAEFIFDVQGRYVVAEDDEARALVGEQVARRPEPRPTQSGPWSGRRLSAVVDEPLHLGDDAIELVTGPGQEAGPDERTVDLTQTARELRRGAGPRPDQVSPTGDADWMATQASDRPAQPRPEIDDLPAGPATGPAADPASASAAGAAASSEAPPADPASGDTPSGSEQGGRPGEESASEPEAAGTAAAEEPAPEPASKKTGRKGRRASVPSWDEIMFGGGRSD